MFERIKKLFYKFEAYGLDRNIRRESSKAREIVEALDLKAGDSVADIGSGSGYFVFEFAKAVGLEGQVFAVDTNEHLLDIVAQKAAALGLHNITIVKAEAIPNLPTGEVDLVFSRTTYHHLRDRISYFTKLKDSLSRRGRVVIIDYDRRKVPFFKKLSSHQTAKEKIIAEMSEAGYRLASDLDLLPEQNFLIFQ